MNYNKLEQEIMHDIKTGTGLAQIKDKHELTDQSLRELCTDRAELRIALEKRFNIKIEKVEKPINKPNVKGNNDGQVVNNLDEGNKTSIKGSTSRGKNQSNTGNKVNDTAGVK